MENSFIFDKNIFFERHETTRHLFYLQVRRDLLEDRCWCSTSQAVTLSALAVQAEYNDHILAGTKNWSPDHYFSPQTLRQVGKTYARDQVMEKLDQFEGMNEKNAEINFLKVKINFKIFLYF